MMLSENLSLEGSRDISGYLQTCARCGSDKPTNDGIHLSQTKWVCGKCWRLKATRPNGAMAALAAEKKRKA